MMRLSGKPRTPTALRSSIRPGFGSASPTTFPQLARQDRSSTLTELLYDGSDAEKNALAEPVTAPDRSGSKTALPGPTTFASQSNPPVWLELGSDVEIAEFIVWQLKRDHGPVPCSEGIDAEITERVLQGDISALAASDRPGGNEAILGKNPSPETIAENIARVQLALERDLPGWLDGGAKKQSKQGGH
jgi:hypothetical protein